MILETGARRTSSAFAGEEPREGVDWPRRRRRREDIVLEAGGVCWDSGRRKGGEREI